MGPKFKYHIIRIPIDKEKKVMVMRNVMNFEKRGFKIIKHYGKHRVDTKMFNEAPEQQTVIIVKSLWRAAKTIESVEHIGIIHEAFAYSKSNSAEVQGLIGRLCGHNREVQLRSAGTHIFCHVESVMNYGKLFEYHFDYTNEELYYNSGTVSKRVSEGCESNGLVSRKCYLDNSDDDESSVGMGLRRPDPEQVIFESFEDVRAFTKDILDAKRGPSIKRFPKEDTGFHTAIRKGKRIVCTEEQINTKKKTGLVGKYKVWPFYTEEELEANDSSKPKWMVYYYKK
jgi:hypothetical protein